MQFLRNRSQNAGLAPATIDLRLSLLKGVRGSRVEKGRALGRVEMAKFMVTKIKLAKHQEA